MKRNLIILCKAIITLGFISFWPFLGDNPLTLTIWSAFIYLTPFAFWGSIYLSSKSQQVDQTEQESFFHYHYTPFQVVFRWLWISLKFVGILSVIFIILAILYYTFMTEYREFLIPTFFGLIVATPFVIVIIAATREGVDIKKKESEINQKQVEEIVDVQIESLSSCSVPFVSPSKFKKKERNDRGLILYKQQDFILHEINSSLNTSFPVGKNILSYSIKFVKAPKDDKKGTMDIQIKEDNSTKIFLNLSPFDEMLMSPAIKIGTIDDDRSLYFQVKLWKQSVQPNDTWQLCLIFLKSKAAK